MSLRLYRDVHIPVAITEALRRRGMDALTSQEDRTHEATDEALLQRAVALGRVLFSQDQDLLRIAHRWQSQQEPFPGLVFARQKRMSIGQCIENLTLIAGRVGADELANQVVFLPLT